MWLGIALVLSSGCGVSAARPSAPVTLSIEDVRRQPASTAVTVEGVVTVASGSLDDGFAVMDGSGGLRVFDALGNHYVPGDRVRIVGTVAVHSGELGLHPSAIERLGSVAVPAALDVPTGSVGMSTLGRLVRVRGHRDDRLVDDWPYGWKQSIDDGSGATLVFIATSTGIDVSRFQHEQQIAVTGYCGQFEDHYEILPRTQSDVEVVPAN